MLKFTRLKGKHNTCKTIESGTIDGAVTQCIVTCCIGNRHIVYEFPVRQTLASVEALMSVPSIVYLNNLEDTLISYTYIW